MEHRTAEELTAGLDQIRQSPATAGRVELIVRRPVENEREVLDEGMLDLEVGLVGDAWKARGSSRTPDGSANPLTQLTADERPHCRPGDREPRALAACGRGRLHVFSRKKISAQAIMASACLPNLFRAVEIDGVPYWDGGYLGNPVIFPFFRTTRH